MVNFIGLDLSIAATGYSQFDEEGTCICTGVIKTKKDDSVLDVDRFSSIADKIISLTNAGEMSFVIIEDYAFSAKGQITRMAELGGIVKYRLSQIMPARHIWTCSPGTLKKFVSGKGNMGKEFMIHFVYTRWGFEAKDNNEADAYGLGKMAFSVLMKPSNLIKCQREGISSLIKSNSVRVVLCGGEASLQQDFRLNRPKVLKRRSK